MLYFYENLRITRSQDRLESAVFLYLELLCCNWH